MKLHLVFDRSDISFVPPVHSVGHGDGHGGGQVVRVCDGGQVVGAGDQAVKDAHKLLARLGERENVCITGRAIIFGG